MRFERQDRVSGGLEAYTNNEKLNGSFFIQFPRFQHIVCAGLRREKEKHIS